MPNKNFTQYQGEQVNQIPAGYVEAMGAMGKAYASVGQSIGSAITNVASYYQTKGQEEAKAKEYVKPRISRTVSEIKGFESSGFLERDANGNMVIAKGKEGMFDANKMGELQDKLELYNRTGGGTKDLTADEYIGLTDRFKAEAELAKQDREERALQAKENALKQKDAEAKQKEKNDLRLGQIKAWGEVSKSLTDLTAQHAQERKTEYLTGKQLDPNNERRRLGEMNDLKLLQQKYQPDFGNSPIGGSTASDFPMYREPGMGFSSGGVRQASVSYPVGDGTGYPSNQDIGQMGAQTQGSRPGVPGQSGISRGYVKGGMEQFMPKPVDLNKYTQTTSPKPQAVAAGETPTAPEIPQEQAPAASAAAPAAEQGPSNIRPIPISAGTVEHPNAQNARNSGNAVYHTDTGAVDYTGAFEVLSTSRGDIRRVTVSTESDFLSTGLKKDEAFKVTADASGHPLIVSNGRMDGAQSKDAANTAGMALRFIMENRVRSFTPTDAQLDAVKGTPLPDASTGISPLVWKRALVAAGIATGRIAPTEGQDINSLSYGDMFSQPDFRSTAERYAAEGSAAASSVNVTTKIVPSKTALQNRTGETVEYVSPVTLGRTPLTFTLPSTELRNVFARNGIAITPDDERYFDSMDNATRFANETIGQQARIAESLNKATEAKQNVVISRASATGVLGTNLGEKLKRYPGAMEPTDQRFGYFTVNMPLKAGAARYTSGDVNDLQDRLLSDDPKVAEGAYRDYNKLMTRLASGGIGEEQMNKAATATMNFNESVGAIAELRIANELVMGEGVVGDLMTRMGFGPHQKELKAADIRAMFLRGAVRPVIAGPGNPAVYEQNMIDATIPNMQSFFTIRSWDKSRIGALALVTASGYVNRMREAGFTGITQDALDDLNAKIKDAYGDKAPVFTRDDLVGANSWMSVSADPKRREEWLRSRNIATVSELNAQNASSDWGAPDRRPATPVAPASAR